MHRAVAVAVTLSCVCPLMGSAQPRVPSAPVRDTSASQDRSSAPATVFGRVTSAATGQGLRDAFVTIRPSRGNERGGGPMSVRVDDDGRFTLRDVPAGEYDVIAQKAGYITQMLGQVSSVTPGRPIAIVAGATTGPVALTLSPGGVITGRVVDEYGAPAERVTVRAWRLRRFSTVWRLLPSSDSTTTDDRGEYRLHSLTEGQYVVGATPPRQRPYRIDGDDQTANEPSLVPAYAPNVSDPSMATRLTVTLGSEARADVVLGAARVARLGGHVIDGTGATVSEGMVLLRPRGLVVQTSALMNQRIAGDGSFLFEEVPPGAYTLTASHPHPGSPVEKMPAVRRTDSGWVDIDVDGADMPHLTLRTSAGASVRGRVIVDGDASRLEGREVRVIASPIDPNALAGTVQARVAPDLSFTLDGLQSTSVLRIIGVPQGWWTRVVRLDGKDVTAGVTLAPGRTAEGLELILSTRPIAVRGTVATPAAAADDAVVVLFSTDQRLLEQSPAAAGIATARPAKDGTFRLSGVRPGRYHVVAVRAGAIGDDISSADFLRGLAAKAETVDVVEGEEPAVALTVIEP